MNKRFYISNLEDVATVMNGMIGAFGDYIDHQNKINKKMNITCVLLGLSGYIMNRELYKQHVEIRKLKKEIEELKETKGE